MTTLPRSRLHEYLFATPKPPKGLDLLYLRSLRRPMSILRKRGRNAQEVARCVARCEKLRTKSDAQLNDTLRSAARALQRFGADKNAVVEALAGASEAARRELDFAAYPEQIRCALSMHHGYITEMATGEGKTLAIALAAVICAWRDGRCHVFTANDYLAQRDAEWAEALFTRCGLHSACITAESDEVHRRAAYRGEVVYATPREIAADFLRDEIDRTSALRRRSLATSSSRIRDLRCALIDEADAVLIDDAITPLILSVPTDSGYDEHLLRWAAGEAQRCEPGRDFQIVDDQRQVWLLDQGERRCESTDNRSTRRQRIEYLTNALQALHIFREGHDYCILDAKVVIIDPATGRLSPDRSYQAGIHQAIEAKHDLPIRPAQESAASISFQGFFRRYRAIAGTSGTVREVDPELWDTYALLTTQVPRHLPSQLRSSKPRSFPSGKVKIAAIVETAQHTSGTGRSVLIGCNSVGLSEQISARLHDQCIAHSVLNATNHEHEAEIIARAGQPGTVTIATNMAGRGTDIELHESTREAGGLLVLLAEPLPSRRLERQLSGRAARQGDPGQCVRFLSVDDDLFTRLAPRLSRIMPTALLPALARALQRRNERKSRRTRRQRWQADESTAQLLGFAGRAP